MTEGILIIGRGPSMRDFDWDSAPMPKLAISSGIFGVPESVRVEHFVTLDPLKFYMTDLSERSEICWFEDGHSVFRPFWRDASLTKHVLRSRLKPSSYRMMPQEVWSVIPTEHLPAFQAAFTKSLHAFGFQPSWGDYQNVRGWDMELNGPPNLTDPTQPIRLGGIMNSLFMAIQVAVLIGYRRLYFLGCDLNHRAYAVSLDQVREWYPLLVDAGVECINLSAESGLAEFMPTTTSLRGTEVANA